MILLGILEYHPNRNKKTDLMKTVLQGKKKSRKTSYMYIDNMKADHGLQLYEVIHQSRDRDRWQPIVARSGAPTDGHSHGDRCDLNIIKMSAMHVSYFRVRTDQIFSTSYHRKTFWL